MATENEDNKGNQDESIDDYADHSLEETNFDTEFKEDLSFDDEDSFLDTDEDSYEDPYLEDDFEDNGRAQSSMNLFNIGIIAFFVIAIAGVAYITLPGILGGDDQPQQTASPPPPSQAQQNTQDPSDIIQGDLAAAEPEQDAGGILANPDLIMTEEDMQDLAAREIAQDSSRVFEALDQPAQSNEDVFEAIRGLDNIANDDSQSMPLAENDTIIPAEDQQVGVEMDTLPLPSDADAPLNDDMALTSNQEQIPFSPPVQEVQQEEPQADSIPSSEVFEFAAENMPMEDDGSMSSAHNEDEGQQLQAIASRDNDEIVQLNARMDSLMATMDQVMERLDGMAQNTSQQTAPSQEEDETIESMRKTIEGMENRIASLTREIEETRESASEQVQRQTSSASQNRSRPKPQPRPTVQYDLRGATMELAYIARQGTDNLQTVRVGDTVTGLGRITSIAMESGRWVVRGTNGIVRQ